ncbi:MAG: methyltransferase domain-containing protein [Haloechinothrix sp.]
MGKSTIAALLVLRLAETAPVHLMAEPTVASMYGEAIADVYDNGSLLAHAAGGARAGETGAAVGFLTERAGTGRVLELGVGTGRIAIALAAGGIEVHGIDVSQAMADQLRAKPGGGTVKVHIGDMAEVGTICGVDLRSWRSGAHLPAATGLESARGRPHTVG